MKKIWSWTLTLVLLVGVIFMSGKNCFAHATTIFNPHLLTTGSAADLKKVSTYNFVSNGQQIYRLDLKENGCLELRMYSKNPGYINVEVYKKSNASDLPTYIGFPCTVDRGNQYTVRQYMKKGTYYLRFPKNTYELSMLQYPNKTREIKNGSIVAAYCDANIVAGFTYKSKQNGYLTITQSRLVDIPSSMSVSFYNSKGKKITDIVSDHEIATKIVFPVKKGVSYKIKIKTLNIDGQQYFQMKTAFTTLNEKSGSTKSKSVAVKLKQVKEGMIYTTDSVKSTDWYKITNPKNQKLKLTYGGDVTSGSINLVLYNKKGKKLGTYYLMPAKSESMTYQLKNVNGSTTIPKGTYYIKLVKLRKETTGVYHFKIAAK